MNGAVQKPGEYKLAQVQSLPRVRQNTRHVCVEGWDVIGRFGGARLSDFLHDDRRRHHRPLRLPSSARTTTTSRWTWRPRCIPQTLLCYEMYDQPLTREHGAPLRLQIPTKIGYKQAKYLTSLKVTNVLDRVGYWEDQGYSSFYGSVTVERVE